MSIPIEHLLRKFNDPESAGHDGRQPINLIQGGKPDKALPTIDQVRTSLENASQSGKEPNWAEIKKSSEAILVNASKHLEAGFFWTLAAMHQEGLPGLAAGLGLMVRLQQDFWDLLHPQMDKGDPFERTDVLSQIAIPVQEDSGHMKFAYRLGTIPLLGAASDGWRIGQVLAAIDPARWPFANGISSAEEAGNIWTSLSSQVADELQATLRDSQQQIETIKKLYAEKVSKLPAPRLIELEDILACLLKLAKGELAGQTGTTATGGNGGLVTTTTQPGAQPTVTPSGEIVDRRSALDALERARRFFQSSEPASPVSLLADLALKLKDRNFIDTLARVSPADLAELQKGFGLDPDAAPVQAPASVAGSAISAPPVLRNRDNALQTLDAVATFFRRNDPSSPVLALVDLCRSCASRDYEKSCLRISSSAADLVTILTGKSKSS